MPIVSECTAPGCETLTVGPFCVDHDAPVTREFVRGRPWSPPVTAANAPVFTPTTVVLTATPFAGARNARKAWARREAARALR